MIWTIMCFASIAFRAIAFIYFNSNLSKMQKIVMLLAAPITIAVLIIGAIVVSIDHICKHGFHDILPRKKSKAYPLSKDDFKYWSKVTIIACSEKMNISEFNVKYGKNLSLDDI